MRLARRRLRLRLSTLPLKVSHLTAAREVTVGPMVPASSLHFLRYEPVVPQKTSRWTMGPVPDPTPLPLERPKAKLRSLNCSAAVSGRALATCLPVALTSSRLQTSRPQCPTRTLGSHEETARAGRTRIAVAVTDRCMVIVPDFGPTLAMSRDSIADRGTSVFSSADGLGLVAERSVAVGNSMSFTLLAIYS